MLKFSFGVTRMERLGRRPKRRFMNAGYDSSCEKGVCRRVMLQSQLGKYELAASEKQANLYKESRWPTGNIKFLDHLMSLQGENFAHCVRGLIGSNKCMLHDCRYQMLGNQTLRVVLVDTLQASSKRHSDQTRVWRKGTIRKPHLYL